MEGGGEVVIESEGIVAAVRMEEGKELDAELI